jgi:DNA polymerase III epsilon subunit-like protein
MKNLYRWNQCRLVQIAWELYSPDSQTPLASKEFMIQPTDFTIPEAASKIHGISMEEAQTKGVPLHEVIFELREIMGNVSTLVAHNIDFDMSVVTAELMRANCEDLAKAMMQKQQICTMKRGTKKGQKWPKLGELYRELFGASPEAKYGDLHRADVDVRCCADIYFHQEAHKK